MYLHIHCGSCVPGVETVEVGDWREGTAVVVADASVAEEAFTDAVVSAGYRAIIQAKRPLEGGQQVPRHEGADFYLMTIGGGSAAFAAAIKAAELGARVHPHPMKGASIQGVGREELMVVMLPSNTSFHRAPAGASSARLNLQP